MFFHNKFGRLIFTYIILFVLVGIMIYYVTKRDFTDENDNVIVCTIEDYSSGNMYGLYPGDYYLYIDMEKDGTNVVKVEQSLKGVGYSDNEKKDGAVCRCALLN